MMCSYYYLNYHYCDGTDHYVGPLLHDFVEGSNNGHRIERNYSVDIVHLKEIVDTRVESIVKIMVSLLLTLIIQICNNIVLFINII